MYGFKNKSDAIKLKGIARGLNAQTYGVMGGRTHGQAVAIVRIGASSGTYGGDTQITWGIKAHDDYTDPEDTAANFTRNGILGKEKLDWCNAFIYSFENEDKSEENYADQRERKTTVLDPKEDARSEWSYDPATYPDWSTNGDIGDRKTVIVHNMSVVPLIYGMIVPVFNMGGTFIYCGDHTILARTSDDGIDSETHDIVNIKSWNYDSSVPTSFDFDNLSLGAALNGNYKVYNPWSDDVPADTTCVIGQLGGVLCVLGWEC
jgi:hypothetical protein